MIGATWAQNPYN